MNSGARSTDENAPAGHWDAVYQRVGPDRVSWYQPEPSASLELIAELGLPTDAAILDVGGGASMLVDALLARGFDDVSVLDVSSTALDTARHRIGSRSGARWLHEDVLAWEPARTYDLWHDRALFHFLVAPAQRSAYLSALRKAVHPGSAVIIATFAADGPDHCSGLAVARYDPPSLAAALGEGFEVIATRTQLHITPAGVTQPFSWVAAHASQ